MVATCLYKFPIVQRAATRVCDVTHDPENRMLYMCAERVSVGRVCVCE